MLPLMPMTTFGQTVVPYNCEQCGALRHYNDKEDQPGEWALPVNKEPKPCPSSVKR